jgi:hypothetical protein
MSESCLPSDPKRPDDYFFQKAGKKITRAENISSLPTSMFQARNHFPKSEIKA